eukprot:XP_024997219.1 uncharacterized protein LOC107052201 isoform X1 [Gallus gallus]
MGKCRSDSISHCGNCFAPLSPSGHSQCCAGLPSPRPLPRKVHCVTQPRSAQLLSVGLQRQTAEGAASIRPSARQLLSLLSPRQPWHRPAAPPSSSSPLCCLRRPLPTNPQRFRARPTQQCRGRWGCGTSWPGPPSCPSTSWSCCSSTTATCTCSPAAGRSCSSPSMWQWATDASPTTPPPSTWAPTARRCSGTTQHILGTATKLGSEDTLLIQHHVQREETYSALYLYARNRTVSSEQQDELGRRAERLGLSRGAAVYAPWRKELCQPGEEERAEERKNGGARGAAPPSVPTGSPRQ